MNIQQCVNNGGDVGSAGAPQPLPSHPAMMLGRSRGVQAPSVARGEATVAWRRGGGGKKKRRQER